jgi:hypothetical protein
LSYLRNKPNPTKQDKESIYSLEMVLRNMKWLLFFGRL